MDLCLRDIRFLGKAVAKRFPLSGGAGNPARALAPMIVSRTFGEWYTYTGGPIVGGVIAAWLYLLVGKGNAPKISVADQSTDRRGIARLLRRG